MSSTFVKVLVPPPVGVPRGAQWASALASGCARFGLAVWRAFERIGQSRADRALRSMAGRHAHRPELADALHDAMPRPSRG